MLLPRDAVADMLEKEVQRLEGLHLTNNPGFDDDERTWAHRIIGLGLAIDWLRTQADTEHPGGGT
jgi:hypothetical protein